MELSNLVAKLDDKLIRECVMYKAPNLMQKTINYTNTSTFTVNLNNQSFNMLNQAILVNENNTIYLYLITDLPNNNESLVKFDLPSINTLEVVT